MSFWNSHDSDTWVPEILMMQTHEFLEFSWYGHMSSWNFHVAEPWVPEILMMRTHEFLEFSWCGHMSSWNSHHADTWVSGILMMRTHEFLISHYVDTWVSEILMIKIRIRTGFVYESCEFLEVCLMEFFETFMRLTCISSRKSGCVLCSSSNDSKKCHEATLWTLGHEATSWTLGHEATSFDPWSRGYINWPLVMRLHHLTLGHEATSFNPWSLSVFTNHCPIKKFKTGAVNQCSVEVGEKWI